MNEREAVTVIQTILAAWPTQRQRMTTDDIRAFALVYSAGLSDLDVELVRSAVGRMVRTSQWLPTVAHIREAAGVVVHGMQKTGGEAWGSVVRALREQGSHRAPGIDFTFNDPITVRVVAALGWRELCSSPNPIADRARFIETYNQISKVERTEAQASDGVSSTMLGSGDRLGSLSIADAAKHAIGQWHDDMPDPDLDEVQ